MIPKSWGADEVTPETPVHGIERVSRPQQKRGGTLNGEDGAGGLGRPKQLGFSGQKEELYRQRAPKGCRGASDMQQRTDQHRLEGSGPRLGMRHQGMWARRPAAPSAKTGPACQPAQEPHKSRGVSRPKGLPLQWGMVSPRETSGPDLPSTS